jgi:hypothetical protein
MGEQKQKSNLKDYLGEELEKICLLEAKANYETITIDEAIEIYKQIQSELLELDYDEKLAKEFLASDAPDETEFTSTDQVICPICQKASLFENPSQSIECESNLCNFKLDCSQTTTKMSLQYLNSKLNTVVQMHCCNEVPKFEFKPIESCSPSELILLKEFSSSATLFNAFLLMHCDKCGFMQFVF